MSDAANMPTVASRLHEIADDVAEARKLVTDKDPESILGLIIEQIGDKAKRLDRDVLEYERYGYVEEK